ncbi:ABC-type cobalt transport system, ATPase component [Halobacteroides halobius DSM 5150]|uniref:ABC-type cobalt transport system, ATPase component n=1 Tax=Halobacteroides halobius (strain ATCC 35273 / DSM 5150 / MD-1) TaxID=748449 RepID=L0KBC9_HALHC|nr:ATP-binding cassette domain-containing protein [Halobacteroides halobius]AGB41689.1 ABC-type cobalt transport system, ATPase component [Halobacteroides halobius DSM 5150]
MKENILQVRDLTFSYTGTQEILKEVSFSIQRNEPTVLLGPNGAGKSTLIFNLLNLEVPDKGQIYLKGQSLEEIEEDKLRQQVAYIFQNPDDQVFAPTVKEDILFGPIQFGLPAKEQEKRLEEVVELLQISHLLARNPRHLSYGEKRRVALAGALIIDPELIFLDEPLAFLDPPGQQLLIEIMKQLTSQGKTLLVATHDLNFAAEWGEKFLVLDAGELVASGDKRVLKEQEAVFGDNLPLVSQVFKKVVPDDKLPLTIKEAKKLLNKLLK